MRRIKQRGVRDRRLFLEQLENRLVLSCDLPPASNPRSTSQEGTLPTANTGRIFEDLDANSLSGGDPGVVATVQLFLDGGDGRFGSDGSGANAGTGCEGDDDQFIREAISSEGRSSPDFTDWNMSALARTSSEI